MKKDPAILAQIGAVGKPGSGDQSCEDPLESVGSTCLRLYVMAV